MARKCDKCCNRWQCKDIVEINADLLVRFMNGMEESLDVFTDYVNSLPHLPTDTTWEQYTQYTQLVDADQKLSDLLESLGEVAGLKADIQPRNTEDNRE